MKILEDEELKLVKSTLSQMRKDRLEVDVIEVTEENLSELLDLCILMCEVAVDQAEHIKKIND